MAARQCPNCLAIVPATKVVAYSNDFVCPTCGRPLAISGFSRNIAAFAGLAAGAFVWRMSTGHYTGDPGAIGWLLPIVFAYLALSVVSPLVLMLAGDLQLKAAEDVPLIHESVAPHPHH
jgi:hypothetical protein